MADIKEIKEAIKEAIQTELGSYKMPKEQHYVDHIWISEQREWQVKVKSWSVKSIVATIITAVAYVIYVGLVAIGKIK